MKHPIHHLAGLLSVLCLFAGGPASADDQAAYEAPPSPKAMEVLPPRVLKGPNHTVREDVSMQRLLFHFTMDSTFGVYEVTSKRLLDIRAREAEIMARVVHMSGGSEFVRSLGKSLAAIPTGAVELITNPREGFRRVGEGASKTGQRIADLFRGRPESAAQDSKAEDAYYGDEKRKLAADLKLDVYSSNPQVQSFLDRIASARAGGSLTIDLASLALPVVGFMAVTTTRWRADAERLLRDNTPTELTKLNARALEKLGVAQATRLAFLRQPQLSPRHKTVITTALGQLSGVSNPGAVLEAATLARDEVGALYHEQQAILLADWHTDVAKLASLERVWHVVVARGADQKPLAFLPADQVYWMEDVEKLADALQPALGGGTLYVTGRVTALAKTRLEARGITVLERYKAPEDDSADWPAPQPQAAPQAPPMEDAAK
jgi:hypothetical protein